MTLIHRVGAIDRTESCNIYFGKLLLLRKNLLIFFVCLFGTYIFLNFSHLTISNLFEFSQVLSFY